MTRTEMKQRTLVLEDIIRVYQKSIDELLEINQAVPELGLGSQLEYLMEVNGTFVSELVELESELQNA